MKKQYKHIPSGEIATFDEDEVEMYSLSGGAVIPAFLIESGEDWQPVIEEKPAYTILSLKGTDKHPLPDTIITHFEPEWFNPYWQIHSVRREIDQQIFTIGDIVQLPSGVTSQIRAFHKKKNILVSLDATMSPNTFVLDVVQKVKTKEWEILAYRNKDTKIVFIDINDWALKDKTCEIFAVKRLSDGVEFKIGDKINGTSSINENKTFGPGYIQINKFEIDSENDLLIHHTTGHSKASNRLKDLRIYKEKLFTTEDDVDIYEGDNFSVLSLCYNKPIVEWKAVKGHGLGENVKFFSTKAAAEKYIADNKPKPLFFTEDHVAIFPGDMYYYVGPLLEVRTFTKATSDTTKHDKLFKLKNFSTIEAAEAYIASQKAKPLFKTEDGKEVFKGDKVLYVAYKHDWKIYDYVVNTEGHKGNTFFKDYKWFSTKEAAENYVLYNKPCLSINDVAKVYITANHKPTRYTKFGKQSLALLNMVKEKIK